jgi:hypothetical protein
VYRRHELNTGFDMERENLVCRMQREMTSG